VKFMEDFLAKWIHTHGGWNSVVELSSRHSSTELVAQEVGKN